MINIDLSKTQQYLDWLKEKLYLNHRATTASKRKVTRGQVYRCNLGVGIGSEECKERPCVILQYNSANATSPNTIVAPITHTTSTLKTVIPIADKMDLDGGVILDGNVLLGNIICVSKARLSDYIADLSNDEMKMVDEAISISLGINHYYQTLKNEYNDKLIYVEKLKSKRSELTEACTEKQSMIEQLNIIMSKYKLSSIEDLENLLDKCTK
ncbi:type II toxin-antitoxin system PemK/MazF family toxin [Anaerosporobacter sp.]|uniref:type II toxin-antitoxin system PemK/MazF family toxin n=1 Tax=Anaerosporobacter sp. TaxID=1872529 RepID=UPI00286EE02F|nr:type II toxin-antitoxin system PemK/MazF family toxin [Anaerosporobacter sp.]